MVVVVVVFVVVIVEPVVALVGGVCGGVGIHGVCLFVGIGKSEAEERCENNVEGGGQGSIDGDEENKSEKEEELESQKEKEDHYMAFVGLSWCLAAKRNTNIKEIDLFNPPDDAVVHPWIVPTKEESVMTSYITLGHVNTITDPTVELIKKELAGATAIRRAVRQGQPNVEALHDQPFTKADLGASSGGVVGVGGPSHPSSPLCSHCECDECKDRQDKLFEKVEAISKAIEEFKSKRCTIPYKKVREPHTPTTLVRRKKRAIKDVLSTRKSKEIAISPSPKDVEVQGLVKKVEIYAELGVEEKRDLRQAKNTKLGAPYYPRPPFPPKDFQTMTDMRMPYEDKHVDIILYLMRKRQLTYQESYDAADRIMDLDFYKNLKDRYVRGDRPNPHGKSWTEAKRILIVISVNGMYDRAVVILLNEGKINVYDSNVPLVDDFNLFLLVDPLMVLLPILLRESKLMNHFPKKVATAGRPV
ncbi:hypothetical protein FXO37_06135 [Capsicum annuum]|nr:hypothetical protein FXO37_06135 [Capsicum annuum]